MDADSDLKDPRSSAFIRGAFAFFLFDSRFAGKGRSRIGQGGTAKANSAHASNVPSRFLAVDRPSARGSILNFAVLLLKAPRRFSAAANQVMTKAER
ncbi:MAG TPA: hypothetical protein VHY20_00960, partial [Pirellulales bacterium]|nr:hypothetical protein [Pirellulales bacterium]